MNEITPDILAVLNTNATKIKATSVITIDHDCKCGWSFNTKDRKSAYLMKIRLHRKICVEWKNVD